MTRATPTSSRATSVPADTDLLCEGCGYTLNGLPEEGRCPECGKLIAETIEADRTPPAWERDGVEGAVGLLTTTANVLFRPTHFYRTLTTRGPLGDARVFALTYWALCAGLLTIATTEHALLLWGSRPGPAVTALIAAAVFGFLWLVTYYAARLTAWEAEYRGLRLPLRVVLRGMYYHAAHVLPVCLLGAATVVTYSTLALGQVVPIYSITTYLYVLCAEVVLGAAYLFWTYWIAMRNMMFANK